MKYKLVMFDFDGTLADSFPWFLTIVDKVADKYHFKRVDQTELDLVRGFDAKTILKYYKVPIWKLPSIGHHVRTLMAEEIHKIALFEGVEVMLHHLAGQGIQLAMVTSNSVENVSRVLGPDNMALFKYLECGVGLFGKDSKIRKVLKKSGTLPGEAIIIGDETRDGEAAAKAKIAFGAVSWGYTTMERLHAHSPREVFYSVAEITEKLG